SCFFSFATAKPFQKIQEFLCQGFLSTPGRTRGFVKPKGNNEKLPRFFKTGELLAEKQIRMVYIKVAENITIKKPEHIISGRDTMTRQ
ncbi:MAG: hypothetical protein IJC74_00015, partial [Clostridia bacterium]|nr:hypothetical protein [Clostridia bacterium]